jgi:hypothetical protein
VTNDDSLPAYDEINGMLSIRAWQLREHLRHTLKLGGQILNPFKTIPSTLIAEFHSGFATKDGLLVPELKIMFAALTFGRGERMSQDAQLVLE